MAKEVQVVKIEERGQNPQEQLQLLDKRYGIGRGEQSKRAQLALQIITSDVIPKKKS